MFRSSNNNTSCDTVATDTSRNPLQEARRGKTSTNRTRNKKRKRTTTPKLQTLSLSSTITIVDPKNNDDNEQGITVFYDDFSTNNESGGGGGGSSSKAHELWFRKIGGGYQLFLEYYSQQPLGTVAITTATNTNQQDQPEDLHEANSKKIKLGIDDDSCTNNKQQQQQSTGGMSRATLKRQRNKQKKQQQTQQHQEHQQDLVNHDGKNSTAALRTTTVAHATMTTTKTEANTGMETHTRHSTICEPSKAEEVLFINPRLVEFYNTKNYFSKYTKKNPYNNSQKHTTINNNTDIQPFVVAMSKGLPITYRIRRTALNHQIQEFQENLLRHDKVSTRNKLVNLFRPINQVDMIYQAITSNVTKHQLKTIYPKLNEIFIKYSQNGVIARQELGSMLPVIALEQVGCFNNNMQGSSLYQAKLSVLDMCASPGSKTMQILEVLEQTSSKSMIDYKNNNPGTSNKTRPSKKSWNLIANDIHPNRIRALQDAISRSGIDQSITAHIVYTCQDASQIKILRRSNDVNKTIISSSYNISTPTETRINNTSSTKNNRTLDFLFDIILCDVPCSGDGTCRKDSHILPLWKPSIGNRLHATQVHILSRAIELLKPPTIDTTQNSENNSGSGGIVCYSTCTLNPIENEAVVAAILQKYNNNGDPIDDAKEQERRSDQDGNDASTNTRIEKNELNKRKGRRPRIEVLDWPAIAGLILRPGVCTWKVADYHHHHQGKQQHQQLRDDHDHTGTCTGTNEHQKKQEGAFNTSDVNKDNDDDDDIVRLTWYDTIPYHNANISRGVNNSESIMPPSLWPPTSKDIQNQLRKCKRLHPQDNDSGGFFVALLRKNY